MPNFIERAPQDFHGLSADPARFREACLRQHLGFDARSYSAIEPADLSDPELEAHAAGLSAQLERLESEAREWHAAAVAEHKRERAAFEATISRVVGELAPHGSDNGLRLWDVTENLVGTAIQALRDAVRVYPSPPRKEPAPGSLGVALDACRRELTARQIRQSAEVARLKNQLASLGVSV